MKKLTKYDLLLLVTLFLFIFISFIIAHDYKFASFIYAIFTVSLCYIVTNNLRTNYVNSSCNVRSIIFFKVLISSFLLIYGWIPELRDINGVNFGYDPQRFYYDSKDLLANNWDPDFLQINYIGIIYYYAFLFKLFGSTPFVAFFSNFILTTFSTLYLIKFILDKSNTKYKYDYLLFFLLLIPEILWFDVVTSRETLMGALIIFTVITASKLFIFREKNLLLFKIISILICLVAISVVRTTMVFAVLISILLMIMFTSFNTKGGKLKLFLIGFLFFQIFLLSPEISATLGGRIFEWSEVIDIAQASNPDAEGASGVITALIVPHSPLESILFTFPRMLLYIISPLPNINFSILGLLNSEWLSWQSFFTFLSSILNIYFFPYVILSLVNTIKTKGLDRLSLTLHLAYWPTFASVAGGVLFIHDRYRVQFAILYLAIGFLGYRIKINSKNFDIIKSIWYLILFFGMVFYVILKISR
jgi:hypothetical protein